MYFSDGHSDYLYGAVNRGYDFSNPVKGQSLSLGRLRAGGVKLQLLAAWMDIDLKRSYLSQFVSMYDAYRNLLDEHTELVELTPDFDPAGERIAVMLTVEGGEAVEGEKDILRTLYRMGVRAMTLTWNNRNELANPALKKFKGGLTFMGRQIVREMGRIGMAVDLSHLNDAGIDDVLEEGVTVFASHSNSRAVTPSPRSLCDEHIKEIARRGGTIGVNFYYKQLTEARTACIQDVVRHAMHIAEVGGIGCLAIGSDFDGMDRYPEGLSNPSHLPALAQELKNAGMTEAELAACCGENLMRFCKGLCGGSKS